MEIVHTPVMKEEVLSYLIPQCEDAVMIETTARTEADCIVTRNIQDFAKSTVPVLTPKDFLRKLADD